MMPVCPRIVLPDDDLHQDDAKQRAHSGTLLWHLQFRDHNFVQHVDFSGTEKKVTEKSIGDSFTLVNNFLSRSSKALMTSLEYLRLSSRSKSCQSLEACGTSSECNYPESRSDLLNALPPYSSFRTAPPVPPSRRKGHLRRRSSTEFNLKKEGIRVLLFRECERRGRKLLYDSATVVRVPVSSLAVTSPAGAAPLTTAPTRGLAVRNLYTNLRTQATGLRGGDPSSVPATSSITSSSSFVGVNKSHDSTSSRTDRRSSSSRTGVPGTTDQTTPLSSSRLAGRSQTPALAITPLRRSDAPSHDPLLRFSRSVPGGEAAAEGPKRGVDREDTVMEITSDYAYQYRRQASDSKQLGELVFGSVALAYRGCCCKLHTLAPAPPTPRRFLLSRTQSRPLQATLRHHHHLQGGRQRGLASDAGIMDCFGDSLGSSLSALGLPYDSRPSTAGFHGSDTGFPNVTTSSGGVSFYLGCGAGASDGLHSTGSVASDLRWSGRVGGEGEVGDMRRTSTTPSEDDSGFGGGTTSWLSSTAGSFLTPLSLPVTPFGSVSSKGSFNSSSGSLGNLQRRFLRRTADTSLDSLAACAEESSNGGAVQGLSHSPHAHSSSGTAYRASPASPSTTAGGSSLLGGSSAMTVANYVAQSTSTCDAVLVGPPKKRPSPKIGSQKTLSAASQSRCAGGGGGSSAVAAAAASSPTRLGLAVVLQPDLMDQNDSRDANLERWLLLHAPVLEASLSRLQAALDDAYLHTSCFVSRAYHAVAAFQQEVLDLLYGPRFVSPVWLRLLTLSVRSRRSSRQEITSTTEKPTSTLGPSGQSVFSVETASETNAEKRALVRSFVDSLQILLKEHDTKDTNFFVSRLVTGVLTHHLGWVTGVALRQSEAEQLYYHQTQGNESGVLNQLLEASGCLGYPPQRCRTLVTGAAPALLHHCLTLLSALVRCQQVFEQDIVKSDYLQLFREEQPVGVSHLSTNRSASLNTSQQGESCSSVNDPLLFSFRRSSCAVSRPCHEKPLRRPGSTGAPSASPLRNASEVTLRRQSDTGSSADGGSCRRASQESVFRRASVDSSQRRPSVDSSQRRPSGDHSNRRTSDDSISSGGSSNNSTLPGGIQIKKSNVNSPIALETLVESSAVGTSRTSFVGASQICQHKIGTTGTGASNKTRRSVATCTDETLFSNNERFKNPVARFADADVVSSVATDDNGNECHKIGVTAVSQISGDIGWNVSTDVIPNAILTKDKDSENLVPRAQSQSFPLDKRLSESSETPTVFNVSSTVISKVEGSCSSHNEALVVMPNFKSSKTCSNLASLALEDESDHDRNDGSDDSPMYSYPKSKQERNFKSRSASPQFSVTATAAGPSVAMTTIEASPLLAHTPPGPLMASSAAVSLENRTGVGPSIVRTAFGPSGAGGINQRSEERLYPCLRHLDGHREVFGPEELHPDVIAQKVRKLCRVTPESSPDRTLTCDSALSTSSAVRVEGASLSSGNVSSSSLKHSNVCFNVNMARNVHESLERTSSPEKVFNEINKQLHSSEVRICAEVIRPEVEDGKKVIFIVGDDEELDQPARQPQLCFNPSKEPSGMISCMPHPHEFREVREARLVSKAGSPEFYWSRNLMSESAAESFVRCASERKLRREHASRHKRTSSDPLAKHKVGLLVAFDSDVVKMTSGTAAMCAVSAPCVDRAVQTETCFTDDIVKETQLEQFRWLQTPTVEVSGADHPCGVAESTLGGVLDHYSPVFVVQAVVNTDTDMYRPASDAARTGCPTSVSVPSLILRAEGTAAEAGDSLDGGEDPAVGGCVRRPYTTNARPAPSAAREVNRASTGQGALSFTSTLFSTSPNRFFNTLSNRSYFSSLGPSASSSRDESVRQPGSTNFESSLTGVRDTNNASATSSCKRELLTSLRRDLEVDSRYSSPQVNHVAIVADVDDWSVNVISGNGCGWVPVGMSPLVAGITDALLQLVQLNATPEMILQCLEDKLDELYQKSHILSNYLLGETPRFSSRITAAANGSTVQTTSYVREQLDGNGVEGFQPPASNRMEGDTIFTSANSSCYFKEDNLGSTNCRGRAYASSRPKGIKPGNLAALPSALGLDLNDLPLLLATASTHSPRLATMYGLAIR